MSKLRKVFTISVMMMTVLSMSVVVAPQAEAAASAGDLIKMDGLSSVYYLGADGKRYVFPNEATYFSWYSDFSGVVTVPQSELESYPLGANVTMRPGTKLVKITTNPKVYAVEAGGNLKAIPDEATAKALYGDDWAKRVVDIADAFFTNYKISSSTVSADAYPAGSLVQMPDSSTVYYINADGQAQKIASEAAFVANRFNWDDVITTAADFTLPSTGTEIAAADDTTVDTSQGGGGVVGTDPLAGSGLTVALASDTPASASLPRYASLVTFAKINFTAANDGDVKVKNLIVTRTGIGASSDFSAVWVYDQDGNRLTSSRTISSSSNTATFSGVNYVVPKGTTKALLLMGSVSGTSGNDALGIASASDITTDGASVSGSFPIAGNLMSLTSVSAGTLTYTFQSPASTALDVGDTQKEVAKMKIEETSSNEDIIFKEITWTNDGAADPSDLVNFNLYQSSTLVASLESSATDRVRMVLDTPMTIKKGSSKIFTLKADIKGGVATSAIQYDIDDATDVVAIGATYGFGVAPTAAESATAITVAAGELTIEIDGPAAYDVVADQDDVVLANMTITTGADEAVEIKNFFGRIDCTDSAEHATTPQLDDGMDNVQLVNTDSNDVYDVTTNDDATNGNTDDYWFKVTSFTVPAGVSHWAVEMDLNDTYFDNGDICQFKMYGGADVADATNATETTTDYKGIEAENLSGKALNDIKPASEIEGNNVTVQTATLTISEVTLSAGDAVSKTKNVDLLKFSAESGSAEATRITAVALQATSTGQLLADAANYSLYDQDGNLLEGGVSSVDATNDTVTFSNLSGGGYTIPAGESRTFMVKADIQSTVNGSMIGIEMKADGITAEDSDGDTMNATTGVLNDGVAIDGRNVTLRTMGTITMTLADDHPAKEHILLSGSTDNTVLKFKANAAYEDITLKDLRFSVTGGASTDNATSSIASVSLYQDGELVKTVSTPTAAYGFVFSNLEAIGDEGITVAKDTDSIFEVKMNMAGIGDGSGDTASSGAQITMTLKPNATGVVARGYSSNSDLTDAYVTVTSVATRENAVYSSKVIATKTSGQSTTLSSGEEEALKFTLTVSGNESDTAQLKDLVVSYSESGSVDVYGFKLYNGAGTEIASTAKALVTGYGSTSSNEAVTFNSVTDDNISGGDGEVYTIKVFTKSANEYDKVNVWLDINADGGTGDDITWNDGADTTGDITWIDLGESSTVTTIKNTLEF